jgi:diaminopimelate decarboxylase
MHDFKYQGNTLYCEKVRLDRVAEAVGTPFYCYSRKSFLDHFKKLKNAFRSVNPLICFSAKANSNLAILRMLCKEGAGIDVVSSGELYRAKKIGAPSNRIVFAGVGKTAKEITHALREDVLLFNVESVPELELIQEIAASRRMIARVSLRLNVEVDPKTHAYIATGRAGSKFGIDLVTARKLFLKASRYSSLRLCGVHIHIGSQITTGTPFVQALRRVARFIQELKKSGVQIQYLNLGGGLGIVYYKERPQTARQFARRVLPILRRIPAKIIMEPGRFISGNSGVFVTQVIYIKHTPRKHFVIVDGGMNDLLRPSLYSAYHTVWPLMRSSNGRKIQCDIVGPICESGDFLAKERRMSPMASGDLLAVMGTGAYGFVMSSNYNSRPRPPEILVSGSRFQIVRRRERFSDLVRGEIVPEFLR